MNLNYTYTQIINNKKFKFEEYLSKSKIIEAIKELLDLSNNLTNNKELRDEIVIISSAFHQNKQSFISGLITHEFYTVTINNITKSLIEKSKTIFLEAEKELKILEEAALDNEKESIELLDIFECEGLGKSFSKTGFRLEGIDICLKQSDILGVVGENAIGKTTLLRLIAGELEHDEGLLQYFDFVENEKVNWKEIKDKIAFIPQELPKWNGKLKANIHYAAAIHGIFGKDNVREVDFIIHRLGLKEYSNHNWHQLSSGYKLRFELAKALVWKPKLLLLDEPLGFLDINARNVVLKDLKSIASSWRYPLCIVITSQDIFKIENIANKMLIFKKDKLISKSIGGGKIENIKNRIFELSVNVSQQELGEILKSKILSLNENGFEVILIAEKEIKANNILQTLIENGVHVKYFREITNSAKKHFV